MANLMVVERYYDISEAHIARGLLHHNGITAFLFDINMANMYWTYLTAISGIRLMVDEADVDKAANILARKDEAIFETGVDNCPSCKAGNVFRHPSWIAAFLALLTVNQILLTLTPRRTCRQCGHTWKILSTKKPAPGSEAGF